MDQYDCYIVHAWEDRTTAEAIADGLEDRGLSVWFNSFVAGRSVRTQMEAGLRASSVGVVIVTPDAFQKAWVREEVDSLYALEEPGETRIIPVWIEVDAETVRAGSPMLSTRYAIVVQSLETGINEAVSELFETIVNQLSQRSQGQLIRSRIASGFIWRTGPAFLHESLRYYDEHFEEFALAQLAHYPSDMPTAFAGTVPVPLIDVLRAPTARAGQGVLVVGRQESSSLQVLETYPEVELGTSGTEKVVLASHVFQLLSVDLAPSQIVYVHALGPYATGFGPIVPIDMLCWVSGFVIAYGSTQARSGETAETVYLTATGIWGSPLIEES